MGTARRYDHVIRHIYHVKKTNSLHLTHHVLLVRGYMFRSLVTIISPFCESILKIYRIDSQKGLMMVTKDRNM